MTPDSQGYTVRADSPAFTFIKPPPVVGYWIFPGSTAAFATRFAAGSKPLWFHCWTMRIVLGFKWENA